MTVKKRRKRKKFRALKVILFVFLLICLILAGAAIVFISNQISKAPDISEVDATPDGYLTTILDKDENEIDKLYVTESNRIYVKLEEIPKDLQNAFIAIEDARFYEHNGIDIRGIFRAAILGITSGNFSQGASTITQQLLKNNVFTDWMDEETLYDSVCRKIQEQYLAVRLEQNYSKDWILENYLNTINLGGGTRGVQVASQYYFGKNVTELTFAESALIAGITKNPTSYNPLTHLDKSLERQHLVLAEMLEQEYISEQQYQEAIAENVTAVLEAEKENRGVQIFSWFEDALLGQVVEDLMEQYQYDEAEAWDLIYSGGLTIHSTQDTQLQKICETTATNSEWYTDTEEISIVITDTSTGAVAAMIGGREEKDSSLVYNRATDAIRQPGSTMKVIGEYAAAIDNKVLSLGTAMDDTPYEYSNGTAIHNSYGSYRGMTTVKDAIASSSNVIALKTYQMIGEDNVFEYLQRFGITTLTDADRNEAISLGGTYNGVSNLEMTAAYNAIANSGKYIRPYYYTKVVDQKGTIILENKNKHTQIIESDTAELLTRAMVEVMTSGTGTEAAVENVTLAGKSGTTTGNKDLWFIGFSAYYTCGVWGGYDNNLEQTSTDYVKHIWQAIMQQAHEDKVDLPIVDTTNLTSVTICKKCGKLAVSELCENTVQGDMTVVEYYAKGMQPSEKCDCHIRVTLCQDSQKEAGVFCPQESQVTKVYLKKATEGTEDAGYVTPVDEGVTCDVHEEVWDLLFGNESDDSENADGSDGSANTNPNDNLDSNGSNSNNSDSNNSSQNNGNWLEDLYHGLFGEG